LSTYAGYEGEYETFEYEEKIYYYATFRDEFVGDYMKKIP